MTANRRRWVVLAVGVLAIAAGSASQFGLPVLIPVLRGEGMTLGQAATLAACPSLGLLLTLVAWGAAADRWGERLVLSTGLALSGLALLAGLTATGPMSLGVSFVLAGAAGASVHASSGRLILGWFPPNERGLAMGIRQTGQPLGMALAALALPPLTGGGRGPALVFLGLCCVAAAIAVVALVRDPVRTAAVTTDDGQSPYRTPMLWRIHAASGLLVVAQVTVSTYALVFLVDNHGWSTSAAGGLLALAQAGGAVSRLASGYWSDRSGSRLRPMRMLCVTTVLVLALLAVTAIQGFAMAPLALWIALVVTSSTNGLAFTAVAEYAGPSWAGKALGAHNSAQNVFALATPPATAAIIAASSYGAVFAAVIAFPLAAAAVVPIERSQS